MATSGRTYRRCDLCGIEKHYAETLYIQPGVLRAASTRVCLRCLEVAIAQLKASKEGAQVIERIKKAG